ncbi:MAG: glycoside hydrolase family 26 protein [Candidatus Symbiothrix sp.]|jgi:mannan endo-1,4-beta-mannosidase|nr:glycoside hydrolase family 26 protein [Candidatus Symbiothrix sp.]
MKTNILLALMILSCITSCKQTPAAEQQLPIDKQATPETVELYNRLLRLLNKGIMVGHQDDLAYGHGWYKEPGRSDVKDVTGDYPAVVAWELGHVELGAAFNLDSVYFADMKQYVKETHARGGITTFSWHGDNIVTGNTAWDCAQDSVVRTVLPNGANHDRFLGWLDKVAAFFGDLKDDSGMLIPVVFRMYHEHSGNWFWWGNEQSTPEEYKQLWTMTVEYLRDTKNVHNLLYSYSPSETRDEAHYLERYPGDDYVDMVAFDCYYSGEVNAENSAKYQDAMRRNLETVTAYAQKAHKIPTIGETGMESIPDSTYFTQVVYPVINDYKISWILFWRNAWEPNNQKHFYAPFAGHPSAPDFKAFVSKERILMNKNIK